VTLLVLLVYLLFKRFIRAADFSQFLKCNSNHYLVLSMLALMSALAF